MSFTTDDYNALRALMNQSPESEALLQKLLNEQQYTISKISHEIRNPLALVFSTLQLIESQHPEVSSFKYWKDMREDIEFMISLLQELSTYNNGERLSLSTFSSYAFISHICLSFAASCAEDNIEFTSWIDDALPEISGDRIKLQEVILNLLRNARDAVLSNAANTTKGTIRLEAYPASLSSSRTTVIIRIIDNGCGIPASQLDQIFEAFVTHKSGGTGLGLAIAKRTIEAHSGTITVSSVPQKETVFTIQLPL